MLDYPNWVLQLVADVQLYEDCHSKVDGPGWDCLSPALEGVPAEVRSMARGYAQAKREVIE